MMWQIVEYESYQAGPQLWINQQTGWRSNEMTQSEAIRRAQQMNDAVDATGNEGEVYYVAERMP